MLGMGVADPDLAACQRHPAEDGAKERALAGAVRAEDRGQAATGDVGRDGLERRLAAVTQGDVAEPQDVVLGAVGSHRGWYSMRGGAPAAGRVGAAGTATARGT